MHTARSRNDQVATDLRLWCRREVSRVRDAVIAFVEVLASRADEADSLSPPARLPGYTHVQHAQPVLLSHHLRAHAWALLRDADRLADALDRMDVSPLGAGALAGSSLPIDPEHTARALGFGEPFANSLDAVSDRDFVAEILFDVALLGVHLSRIGEEWVLWTSAEFGFAVLDDAYATGSSMLPQKKNADIAELARGKAGRLIGNLTAVLATLKGLPLAYNRDLQEDKEPLFDSVDQVRRALVALSGMVATATFRTDVMSRAADAEALVATDIAEWLVAGGVPFRQAHAIVGAAVRDALEKSVPLVDIVRSHPQLGEEAAALFVSGVAVERRRSPGAAGPGAAQTQKQRLDREVRAAKERTR
jgi:argininosuccinate lyase